MASRRKRLCYRILQGPAPQPMPRASCTSRNSILGTTRLCYRDGGLGIARAGTRHLPERTASSSARWRGQAALVACDAGPAVPASPAPERGRRQSRFWKGGEIFLRAIKGASAFAYRVHEDGTGLRKVSEQTIAADMGVSQAGQWVVTNCSARSLSCPLGFGVEASREERRLEVNCGLASHSRHSQRSLTF